MSYMDIPFFPNYIPSLFEQSLRQKWCQYNSNEALSRINQRFVCMAPSRPSYSQRATQGTILFSSPCRTAFCKCYSKNSTTGTNYSPSSDTTPPFLAAHLKMAHYSLLSTGLGASFGHRHCGLVATALRAAQPKNLGSIPALVTIFLMGAKNANAHASSLS